MHYLYNDNLQLSSTQLHLLPTSKIYCSHFFFTNVINKLPDYKTLISLALIRNRELHKERFIILKPCLNHVFVPVKTMYIASSVNFERINDFDLTYFHCMFLYKNNVNITFNYPWNLKNMIQVYLRDTCMLSAFYLIRKKYYCMPLRLFVADCDR